MTLQEKIAVMQAAERGETIQHKNTRFHPGFTNCGFKNAPDWQDCDNISKEGSFNFRMFDYRIKPKMSKTKQIDRLATQHHIHIDDLRTVAALAKTQRRANKTTSLPDWDNDHGQDMPLTIYNTGDVQYGCQFFYWEDIEAYAKAKGFWS